MNLKRKKWIFLSFSCLMMVIISSRAILASSAADDPFQTWIGKIARWSTTNLPSVTFPNLKDAEVMTAAEILSKVLDELRNLPESVITSITEPTAQSLFEIACLEKSKTGLVFEVRNALVGIAEKVTNNLHFEYWADILGSEDGRQDEELLYSAKAAKCGHEESKQFLIEKARERNQRAIQLLEDYELLTDEDEICDESDD